MSILSGFFVRGSSGHRTVCPAAVTFCQDPAGRSQHRTISVLDPEGRFIGQLTYQLCHVCHSGRIHSIAIADPWQGLGLGREAVHLAIAACPLYTWTTTRQSFAGRRFFAALCAELDMNIKASLGCVHMRTGSAS
ncbi:N-acetyltransferase [Streptomyces sp. T-3]|nr:N-acetyltransferase [Streptomyces sp. T-3]